MRTVPVGPSTELRIAGLKFCELTVGVSDQKLLRLQMRPAPIEWRGRSIKARDKTAWLA